MAFESGLAVAAKPIGSRRWLAALGPGVVVMFADTEVGSVITATQSGAAWGYRLLWLQFMIIPVLFMAQELAARLALGTGKGYEELVRQRFGRGLATVSMLTLVVSCFGALVTQMSGLASVGQMFGIPAGWTVSALVALIVLMVLTSSYRGIERFAIGLGAFELAFVVVAWKSHPDSSQMLAQWHDWPIRQPDFLYLVAANIGTSLMPWTLFYQQSALIDKGLTREHLSLARSDTAIGALLCQGVTAAILIAAAATFHRHDATASFSAVGDIAKAFTAALGPAIGREVLALGIVGGAMVATIVVCLSVAWAVGELRGARHSLEQHPLDAPWFYAIFVGVVLLGAGVVLSGVSLVRLSIAVGALNALLLPLVLGLLYALARSELSGTLRLRGAYAVVVAVAFIVVAVLAWISGMAGAWA